MDSPSLSWCLAGGEQYFWLKNLAVTLLFPIFVAENRLSNEENEEDFDDFAAALRDSITAGSVWQ